MGTTYRVKIADPAASKNAAEIKRAIDERLLEINRLMSTYDPDSELSRFNRRRSTRPFPVSPETYQVVRSALRFAKETGGAFDPTVGPLVDLWGFGPTPSRGVPSAAAIQSARSLVGWTHLELLADPPRLRKLVPGLRLDLSAIAKGYGVDEIGRLLERRDLRNYMVEIGGEVFARGRAEGGRPWRLGIDRPAEGALPGRELSAVVELAGRGLATSGGYRNFFIENGKRYAHFIDPRSGRPVRHRLASVSVIAPSCMEADAAATSVMVLGPDRGKAWLEKHEDWDALLIKIGPDGGYVLDSTPGFPLLSD